MNIARVSEGIVVNVEVADEEWLAANQYINPDVMFIVLTDSNNEGNQPHIGLGWSEEFGFEQPQKIDGIEEIVGPPPIPDSGVPLLPPPSFELDEAIEAALDGLG